MAMDLESIKATLTYDRQATTTAILEDMGTLAGLSQAQSGLKAFHDKRAQLGCWGGPALLLAIIALLSLRDVVFDELPLIALLNISYWLGWVYSLGSIGTAITLHNALWWLGRLGCLGLVIFGLISRSRATDADKLDLESRRYELMDTVLKLVGEDIADEAQLTLHMDMRPATHPSKKQRQGKVGSWNVTYYLDPWLRLSGKLCDGTRFKLAMVEKHQERTKIKRSRRGKIKRKSKQKSSTETLLQLTPKPGRYSQLQAIGGDARGAIQLPENVTVKALDASAESLSLRTLTDWRWNSALPKGGSLSGLSGPHLVSLMFLSLFQVLNLSRHLDRSGRGPNPDA